MILRAVSVGVLATLVMSTNAATAQSVDYVCGDGMRLIATFSPAGTPPGSVELVIGDADAKITLPQVKSADGGRYANGDVEFWIRGRDATFMRDGRKAICKSK
jgi:membrane-bound inhibitor of C-type lysozyme